MKWQLDDLPVFLAVVEQAGISAAARALGAPKSTVSAALARLETGLGLRLLDRSSRTLRLTAEGEAFQRQAQLIVEQAREADALMGGLASRPAGRLTVALPPAFTQDLVAPRLPQFRQRYPAVDLEIIVTTLGAAMVRDSVDLAVVVGALEDSELVSRALLEPELIWVASPLWLASNTPGEGLDTLRSQVQICETRYAQRRLRLQVHGEEAFIDLTGAIKVNHPLVVRRVVEAGGGVSLLPRTYCADALAEGRLVQVLPHCRFAQVGSRLTVVYPGRRLLSPRVRVFLEFLNELVSPRPPSVDPGTSGP
jgi:DNA-binding transcriptional LysR family regulator